ncbi:hypothetical protein HWV62_16808 [Athelia sp. TMB]|nr:hypothetical protein HWV62_16808 [Athelia sp. TMB]
MSPASSITNSPSSVTATSPISSPASAKSSIPLPTTAREGTPSAVPPATPTRPSTASPATSPAVSASEFLAEKLRNARDALIARGSYLGVTGVADGYRWERVGRTNKLVTAAAATAHREAQIEYAANPDSNPVPEISPAVLSAVVLITEDDFYMTSCGMWNGPTTAARTFADVKPTCTGAQPDHAVFANDFPAVCENITALMEKARTPGFKDVKGVKVNTGGSGIKIKFRHVLFERKDSKEDNHITPNALANVDREEIPRQFTMAEWPAFYDQAKEALATMKDTHNVNYLEAYDMHGRLIFPREYRTVLSGALAQIHFTLSHWSISGKGRIPSDVFAADVYSIRVLVPPKSRGGVTPRKRKFQNLDPMTPDISPKKLRKSP